METLEDRIRTFLLLNENLAFSLLELVGRFVGRFRLVQALQLLWSLSRLERKGLIKSKVIGGKKFYISNHYNQR